MKLRVLTILVPVLYASVVASCHRGEPPPTAGDETEGPRGPAIILDGQKMSVSWSDGDTFAFTSGPHQKAKVRLLGFNTLESYGAVHRWGEWTAKELYEIAKSSQGIGESRVWTCEQSTNDNGGKDGYGRLLLRCPDAALEIVGQGHAHVMAVDDEPSPSLLAAQRAAQQARRGIWKKGVPPFIVTSVHSADEDGGAKGAYNRVADTSTGKSTARGHSATYETCQEVCEGPPDTQSCMVYVPYEKRYRDRPPCLGEP